MYRYNQLLLPEKSDSFSSFWTHQYNHTIVKRDEGAADGKDGWGMCRRKSDNEPFHPDRRSDPFTHL